MNYQSCKYNAAIVAQTAFLFWGVYSYSNDQMYVQKAKNSHIALIWGKETFNVEIVYFVKNMLRKFLISYQPENSNQYWFYF